ncbi:hypothetical protein JCM11641_003738 [Rhodosporidiobolus odoratus]
MALDFEPDNTTVALGSFIALAIVASFYFRPPPPQIHPFILGRQSVSAPTRQLGQSPVFTTAINGGVHAPRRPDTTTRTLPHLLEKSLSVFEGGARGSWVTGGEKVTDVVNALRSGLLSQFAGLEGNVLVAVEDPTDALLVILALATSPLKPVVVAPGAAIPAGLEVVAAVQTANGSLSGGEELSATVKTILLGAEHQEEAFELLATGKTQTVEPVSAEPNDTALSIIVDGVALALSHQSLTASLVAWLSLFPASPQATKPTIKDYLVSFHHPSTPYGFGLALLAIYQNAALSLLTIPTEPVPEAQAVGELFAIKPAPPASLVFAPTNLLAQPLYTLILQQMLGDSSFIVRHAREGKLRLLRSGNVSKMTIWDSLLFKGLRKDLHLTHIRGLFLSGPVEQNRLDTFRAVLGCPAVATLEHPFLLAPLSNGNMWDFQRLPPPGVKAINGREKAHVGPPTLGVEVKLQGDEKEIQSGRLKGEILIRTPLLPLPATLPSSLLHTDTDLPPLPPYPNKPNPPTEGAKWLMTGIETEMSTEGTLWVEGK